MLIDLVHPVVNCLEGVAVSDIINNDDAVSTLVVGAGDGLEAFLASSVPLTIISLNYNLKLDSLALDWDSADFLSSLS